jgi:hypothetical protein
VPISYLRSGGQIYLSIAFHHIEGIRYEEYKNFPSYKNADEYNGVPPSNFNAEKFAANLEAAYQDMTAFLGNVQNVDEGALDDKITAINQAAQEYKAKVQSYIERNSAKIFNCDERSFGQLKKYVAEAGSRTADYIRDASQSSKRDFLERDIDTLIDQIAARWQFQYIEKIIETGKRY